ncbi:MAG: hypothetical protein VKK59_06090 [Vampirovibrionales bacterium]|nr:hypothetical protein [Vampirovibrionales bacterium]
MWWFKRKSEGLKKTSRHSAAPARLGILPLTGQALSSAYNQPTEPLVSAFGALNLHGGQQAHADPILQSTSEEIPSSEMLSTEPMLAPDYNTTTVAEPEIFSEPPKIGNHGPLMHFSDLFDALPESSGALDVLPEHYVSEGHLLAGHEDARNDPLGNDNIWPLQPSDEALRSTWQTPKEELPQVMAADFLATFEASKSPITKFPAMVSPFSVVAKPPRGSNGQEGGAMLRLTSGLLSPIRVPSADDEVARGERCIATVQRAAEPAETTVLLQEPLVLPDEVRGAESGYPARVLQLVSTVVDEHPAERAQIRLVWKLARQEEHGFGQLIHSFDFSPLTSRKAQMTVRYQATLGSKHLFEVSVGHWRAVLRVDEESVRVHTVL